MTGPDSSGGHFHFSQDINVALDEIDQALRGFAGRVQPAVNQLNESLSVGISTNPAGVEEFVNLLKGAVEQAQTLAREAGTQIQENLQRGLSIDFAPFERQATQAVEAIQAIFQRGLSSGALHPSDYGALSQTLSAVSGGFKEQITSAAGGAAPDFSALDRRTTELAQQMEVSATGLARIADANANLEAAGQSLRAAVEEQARVQTVQAQRVAEAGEQDVAAQNEARVARNAAADKVRLASEGVAAAEEELRVQLQAMGVQVQGERAEQDRAFRAQMDREITPQQLVAESRVAEGNGLFRNDGPYGPLTVPLSANVYGRLNDQGANPAFYQTIPGKDATPRNPLGSDPSAREITQEQDPARFADLENRLSIARGKLANTTTQMDEVERNLIRASELLALKMQDQAVQFGSKVLNLQTGQGFQLRDNTRADGRTEAIPLGEEGTRQLQAKYDEALAAGKLKSAEELAAEATETAAKAQQELALGARLATERMLTAQGQSGGALALGNNNFQLSTGEFVKREGESARLITSGNELADAETGLKEKQARLAAVIDRRINAEEGTASGILQGFKGGFTSRGFESNGDPRQSFAEDITNLSATAGVLAKYSLAGEGVKLASEALSNLREGTIKYTEEVELLNIFLEHLNEGLGETNQATVDLYGAQLTGLDVAVDFNSAIAIGTSALAAYQDEIRQGANANDVFSDSIQQAGVNALITGQQAEQSAKQLLAITQSYGTGSGGQATANDAIFNARAHFGGDAAQISQAVAAAAPLASQGGIDQNTLAAMAALINARTTQSGTQIASTIERLVSRSQNTQFLKALSSQGIADTGNVTEELTKLSEAYNKLDKPGQQALQAQLGSSRALTGLIPLLRSFNEINDATAGSFDHIGAAQDAANKHLETFGGQLQHLGAVLKTLAVDVGTSGIFAPIGVALELIAPPLEIVTDLLGGMEKAIGPVGRNIGGLVVDLLLAAKAYTILQAAAAKEAATRAASLAASKATKAEFIGSAAVAPAETSGALSAQVAQKQAAAQTAAAEATTANARAQELLKATIDGTLPSVAAITELTEAQAAAERTMIAEAYALNELRDAQITADQGLFEAESAVVEVTNLSIAAQEAAAAAVDAHAASLAAATAAQEAYNAALTAGLSEDDALIAAEAEITTASELATAAIDAEAVALQALAVAGAEATASMNALKIAEAEQGVVGGETAVTRTGFLGRFGRGGGEGAGAAGAGGLATTGFVVAGLAVVALADKAVQLGRSLWEADQAMDTITHGSLDDLTASAERLATARSNINAQSSGVLGSTVDFFEGHPARDKKREIDAQIAELKVQSEQLNKAIPLGGAEGAPLPGTTQDLTNTLQNLSDSGASADSVMKYLISTLDGLTGASTRAADAIKPGSLVLPQGQAGLTQGVLGSLKDIDLGTTPGLSRTAPSAALYGDIDKSGVRQSLLAPGSGFLDFKGIDPTAEQQKAVREAITQTLDGLGKSAPGSILTPDDQKLIAKRAAEALNLKGQLAALQPALEKEILAFLGQEALKPLNAENVRKDPTLLNNTVKQIITTGNQRTSEASARGADSSELLSIQQKNLADLDHAMRSIESAKLSSTQLASLTQGLAVARKNLFDAYQQRVKDIAAAAEASLGNTPADQARKAAIEKQVASILTQANKTDPTLLSGDFTTLSGAQDALTNAALTQAHNAEVAADNLIRQALADAKLLAQQAAALDRAAAAAFASGDPSDFAIGAAATNAADAARAGSAAASHTAATTKPVKTRPLNDPSAQPGIDAAGQSAAAAAASKDTAAQIAAARYAASIFPGDQVGEASAAVRTARANLAAQVRGTVAYYDALKSLHQAEQSYANAILQSQANSALLGLDRTNPVLVAREKLREAQAKLNADRRAGAPGSVLTQDKLAVGDAQSQAEAAAFNQRFSDAQTNDQLGRISHAAYLNYLNNEHNRLTAIRHRTRQQQEELNQIDQALKAASDQMAGQFNIGDIKIPTIYEVRRSIATHSMASAGDTGYQDNRQVSITINGGDLSKVRAELEGALGTAANSRVTVAPRKS